MDKLQLGDLVLTTNGIYEIVYSFGHRTESSIAQYLQFLPSKLEISGDHIVFLESSSGIHAIPASLVKIGDQLMYGEKVTGIKTVTRQGVYAPFTPSGTIVVNGVGASSYIAFQGSESLKLGSVSTGLSYHFLAHKFQAPYRLWCSIMSDACMEESYSDDGVSMWVDWMLKMAQWFLRQHVCVMCVMMIPLMCTVGILSVLEFVVLYPGVMSAGACVWIVHRLLYSKTPVYLSVWCISQAVQSFLSWRKVDHIVD